MRTNFIHTENGSFYKSIDQCLKECDELFFSVAFASRQGLGQIKHSFDDLMLRGGAARFCFDVTQGMTDPDVIEELATYPGESAVRMLFGNSRNGFSHSKIYQFKSATEEATSIVGSSNLSIGGLKNNSESSLLVTDGIVDGVNSKIRDYLNEQWNSIHSFDLFSNADIFSEYRRIYESRKHPTAPDQELQKQLATLAAALSEENLTPDIKKLDWYYLLGVLVANANLQTVQSLETRTLKFRFASNVLNSNNHNRGYIVNEIGGVELGLIKLPQNETNRKHIQRISQRLFAWLNKIDPAAEYEETINEATTLSYSFNIRLPSKTEFSKRLFSILKRHLRSDDGKMAQFLPDSVEALSKQDLLKFVQGYSDFRGRLSVGDRAGTAGKLRIALQVNTADTDFLHALHDAMAQKLKYEINVSDGTERGRDNMLRITATSPTVQMFASGWRRRMANEFALFNATL